MARYPTQKSRRWVGPKIANQVANKGTVRRCPVPTRELITSWLQNRVRIKGGRKIRVVFICGRGESSGDAQRSFEGFLKERGFSEFFDVSHFGTFRLDKRGLVEAIKGQDFIVSMGGH